MHATIRFVISHAALLLALAVVPPTFAQQEEPPPCPTGSARVPCLAERGHVQAQFQMGMLAFRKGGEADMAEALDWFRRAAEVGFPRAQYMLGMMYWEGWGTAKNPAEALKWVTAAERGGVFDGAKLKPRIEAALAEQEASHSE